jgi:hypothetical protein
MDITCSQGGIVLFETEVDDEMYISDFNRSLASWIFEVINFRVTSFCPEDPDTSSFLEVVTEAMTEDESLVGGLDVRMQLDKPTEDAREVSTSEDVHELANLSFGHDPPMFKIFLASENGISLDKADDIHKWDEDDEEERIRESVGLDRETWGCLFQFVEFKEDALEPDSYELVGEYNGDKYICHDQ